jgi:NADH-quinone oxidoreductase subunit M
MIPATLSAGRHEQRSAALYYSLMLLLEAGLLGVFAALDIVLYLIALGFVAFPLFWLIAQFGRYERLSAAKQLFAVHVAGTLLISCGLLATATAHARMNVSPINPRGAPTFDARQLIFGGTIEGDLRRVSGLRELVLQQETALDYWDDIGPWIFLALFAGFSLLAAVVPCHLWMLRAGCEAPTSAGMLLVGIGPTLGAYGMARFVVPLFPAVHLPAVGWIATFGVLSSLVAALLSLAQNDLLKLALYLVSSQVSLGVAGIFSFNVAGLTGGLLLIVSAGLATAALLFLSGPSIHRTKMDVVHLHAWNSSRRTPWVRIACLSIIGVPGLGGFVGQFLVLQGLFAGGPNDPGSPLTAVGALAAIGLVTWSVLRFLRSNAGEASRHSTPDEHSLEQTLSVGVCLAALLFIGIFPATITRRMERSVVETVAGRPVPMRTLEPDEGRHDPAPSQKNVLREPVPRPLPMRAVPLRRPRA